MCSQRHPTNLFFIRQAVDMWTMRLTAHRAGAVDNAALTRHALPTAPTFRPHAHRLTSCY